MDVYENKLNTTQNHIMGIVKPVLSILEKMDIKCWMQGGTMLGAIRHKGFIPWDDDIDLGIMRNDYDRFIEEVENYLPAHLKLHTYWDNSDHHYYFARIVDDRYKIKRMGSTNIRYEDVWVDIFPLDGMPNRIIPRYIHMFRLSWARLVYHLSTIERVNVKRPGRPLIERVVIQIALVMRPLLHLNTRKALGQIDRLLKKYSLSNSKYIINFTGQTSFHFTEMLPKTIYGEGTMYAFEDISMLGPKDYDTYLKSLYGDYMTPPKDTDKNAHFSKLME